MYGRSEHLIGDFNLDKKQYQIGIIDLMNPKSFTYDTNPEIALLSNNSIVKDSLSKRDLLKLGEFLKLNNKYYRFENITIVENTLHSFMIKNLAVRLERK